MSMQELIQVFSEAIASRAKVALVADSQPEEQLKQPVSDLLIGAGSEYGLSVSVSPESRAREMGVRPDLGVVVQDALIGHVELKAPGLGANPRALTGEHNAKQWEKLKEHPNLIYTDGNLWALYREGETVRPPAPIDDGLLVQFLTYRPLVPRTPKALAALLAPLCRLVRSDVLDAVQREDSSLATLARGWRELLFADSDDHAFADAYAQTLTYALLLARFSGAESLYPGAAEEVLRAEHGLLAEVLRMLTNASAYAEIQFSVELLQRHIEAVQPDKLRGPDPWTYFYEDFLAAYDKKLRSDRGVYYTPHEVVDCQVRLVSELLSKKPFNRRFAFADEGVVFLDPACGTGAYPVSAIEHSLALVRAEYGAADKASVLARNMFAFELLVGPYAVTHLRLTKAILDAGGTLPPEGAHVYLADTLESAQIKSEEWYDMFGGAITEEHKRVAKVKNDTRVLVCMGNPPYDRQVIDPDDVGSVARKGGWVRNGDSGKSGILADFTRTMAPEDMVHTKNLYNDYVYFWRWALWKVFEAPSNQGPGIVSFITASSYLRGPGFKGMREHMRRTLDEIWVIDLGGDNIGARKSENVFNIQTPVCIAICLRRAERCEQEDDDAPLEPAVVHYASVEGTRDEKLSTLEQIRRLSDLDWRDVPSDWQLPFLPQREASFHDWPLVTALFPWQTSGVQAKRTWPIAVDRETLQKRWRVLLKSDPERRVVLMKESRDRKATKAYESVLGDRRLPSIATLPSDADSVPPARYGYRSFDRRWILPDARIADYLRPSLWRAHSTRQVYMVSLLTKAIGKGPAATVSAEVPEIDYFCARGAKDVIPLWRDSSALEPNITTGLLPRLGESFGSEVSPEDFFSYCYALLHAPSYTRCFWEELSTSGPRIPITADESLFRSTAAMGRELISVQTYGDRFQADGPYRGECRCIKELSSVPDVIRYDQGSETLYFGDGSFAPVSKSVWEFSVSDFKPLQSYLKARTVKGSGKKSSPLDDIRPNQWTGTVELLELIWLLEHSVKTGPRLDEILDKVAAGSLIPTPLSTGLPTPYVSSGEPRLFPVGPHTPGALFVEDEDLFAAE